MSFYAGSAGSVIVPTTGSAYGVPVTHSVHAQPLMSAQPVYHRPPALGIAPTMHYQQPVHYSYAQPRVAALPAVPLTANPLMYQSYGYGGYAAAPGYYPHGAPTVVISSSRSKRHHRRHSSRGFLGYL